MAAIIGLMLNAVVYAALGYPSIGVGFLGLAIATAYYQDVPAR